ncbi:hypothetical protein HNQ08_002665 [Deinococcus humi]|uniref:Transposase IS4-like domain-containing protein n=1 Tax=Deinococcus humi TaxID=662880 RepID=A0A7W8JUV2_9DEIO|nr:hypothetical protein [Deinococcus humi]
MDACGGHESPKRGSRHHRDRFGVWETCQLSKLLWPVECTFGSLKSPGFDLKRTGVPQPKRLERLFSLVTLAWLSCLRVEVWWHKTHPTRVLAHGRKAMSQVRYGTEWLRNPLRWHPDGLADLLARRMTPFSAP